MIDIIEGKEMIVCDWCKQNDREADRYIVNAYKILTSKGESASQPLIQKRSGHHSGIIIDLCKSCSGLFAKQTEDAVNKLKEC